MNGGQRKPPQRKNADPFALGAVDYYATKHGVDPKLALGVADQETGFMGYSPQALSPAGARGTMQVMKGTGLRHVSPERFETAEGQIEAGILELRRLSDQHKGDVRKITRGYLGGAVDPYSGITAEQYAGHVQGFAGDDDDDPFAAAAAELGKPVNEAQSIINDIQRQQEGAKPAAALTNGLDRQFPTTQLAGQTVPADLPKNLAPRQTVNITASQDRPVITDRTGNVAIDPGAYETGASEGDLYRKWHTARREGRTADVLELGRIYERLFPQGKHWKTIYDEGKKLTPQDAATTKKQGGSVQVPTDYIQQARDAGTPDAAILEKVREYISERLGLAAPQVAYLQEKYGKHPLGRLLNLQSGKELSVDDILSASKNGLFQFDIPGELIAALDKEKTPLEKDTSAAFASNVARAQGGLLAALPRAAAGITTALGSDPKDGLAGDLLKLGDALQDSVQPAYLNERAIETGDTFWGQLGAGLGSLANAAVGGAAIQQIPQMAAINAMRPTTGLLSRFSPNSAVFGAIQTGGQAFDEAIKAGASREQALAAGILNSLLGLSEGVGAEGLLDNLALKRYAAQKAKDVLLNSGEEFSQEFFQGVMGDAIKELTYDPNTKTFSWENIKKNLVSGGIGAILGGGVTVGSMPIQSVSNRLAKSQLEKEIASVQLTPEEQELVTSLSTLARGGNLSVDRIRELREQAIAEGDVRAAAQADAVLKEVGTNENFNQQTITQPDISEQSAAVVSGQLHRDTDANPPPVVPPAEQGVVAPPVQTESNVEPGPLAVLQDYGKGLQQAPAQNIDAAVTAATSPTNDLPQPTEAQMSGNRRFAVGDAWRQNGNTSYYSIKDSQTGYSVPNSYVQVTYNPATKHIHVDNIGTLDSYNALKNKLGGREIRGLLDQIASLYPDARTIGGDRWTGVREGNRKYLTYKIQNGRIAGVERPSTEAVERKPAVEVKQAPAARQAASTLAAEYNAAATGDSSAQAAFKQKHQPMRFGVENAMRRREDFSVPPDFRDAGDGDYLAVPIGGNRYEVTPRFGLNFSEGTHTSGAMGEVFNAPLPGRESYAPGKYTVTKPAIFERSGNQWELVEPGRIEVKGLVTPERPATARSVDISPDKGAVTPASTQTKRPGGFYVEPEKGGVFAVKASNSEAIEIFGSKSDAERFAAEWSEAVELAREKQIASTDVDEIQRALDIPRGAAYAVSVVNKGMKAATVDEETLPASLSKPAPNSESAAAILQEYGKTQATPAKKRTKSAKAANAAIQPTDSRSAADAWAKVANASDEQRNAAEVYFRALARGFVKMNPGKSESDFYSHFAFRQSKPGDVGKGAFRQGEKITDSPEFKRWFGDSKVVDENGEPLVVYHGTTGDFDSFHPDSYFTDNSEVAAQYGGDSVYPVYLKINKPFTPKSLEDLREIVGDDVDDYYHLFEALDSPKIRKAIQSEGYDGVVFKDVAPDSAGDKQHQSLLVFSPTQIKSATGNRGTFDPSNPNILEQTAWHGSPYVFDKFTLDHIGKGEGAQAYGWGLYFAESESIARYYKDKLSKDRLTVEAQEALGQIVYGNNDALLKIKGLLSEFPLLTETKKVEAPASEIQKEIIEGRWGFDPFILSPPPGKKRLFGQQYDSFIRKLRDLSDELKTTAKETPAYKEWSKKYGGALYRVDLAPAEDEYLLWDKLAKNQGEMGKRIIEIGNQVLQPIYEQIPEAQKPVFNWFSEFDKGSEIYKRLGQSLGSERAASEYLKENGIRGIKYLDGSSRNQGEGSFNYVIFDDADIVINEVLQQQANGAIEFENGRAIIHAFEAANFSTLIHETAHLARRYLDKESAAVIDRWAGFSKAVNDKQIVDAEEKFARAFERYMRSGKAPIPELQDVFSKIKAWMKEIYKTIKGSPIDVKFNKNVEMVFARMLGADAEFVRTTPKKDAAKLSLGQLIRQAGGLKYTKNDKGELKWMRESRMGRQPGFINSRGIILDEAIEVANGAGFEFETRNDFLDALMEEARGNKQFVPELRSIENETAEAFDEEGDTYNEYLAERDEADHNRLQEAYADPDFDAAMSRLILEGVNEERLEQLRTVTQAKLGWSEEAADRFIRHIQEEDAARLDEEGTDVEGYETGEREGDVGRVSTDDAARVSAVFDSLKQQASESGRPLATVIDEYLRQGSLFSQSELTPQQQQLLSDMAAKTHRGKDTSEQGGLFGDTSPTVESTLEKKKEDDKKRQQAIDTLFQESEGNTTSPSPLPSHVQAALTARAAHHAQHTGTDYKAWSEAMVKDAGEWVRPYLKEAYKAVKPPAQGKRSLPQTLEDAGLESGDNLYYDLVDNESTIRAAEETLKEKGVDGAAEMVRSGNDVSAEATATAIAAIAEYQKQGKVKEAAALASDLAEKMTRYGQAIQAAKVAQRFGTAQALMTGEKIAKKNGKEFTETTAKVITEAAQKMEAAQERIKELESIVAKYEAGKQKESQSRKAKIQKSLDAAAQEAMERLAALNITPRTVASSPGERGAIGGQRADRQTINDFASVMAAQIAQGDNDLSSIRASLSQQFGSLFDANARAVEREANRILREANKPTNTTPRTPTARAQLAREVRTAQSQERQAERAAEREAARWDRGIQDDAKNNPDDATAFAAKLFADGKVEVRGGKQVRTRDLMRREWTEAMRAKFGDVGRKKLDAAFQSGFAKVKEARAAHKELGEIRRAEREGAVTEEQIEQVRKLLNQQREVNRQANKELAAYFDSLAGGRKLRILSGVRKAGLLSSIRTHLKNFTGNIAYQVFDEFSRIPGVVVDFALSAHTKQRGLTGASPVASLDSIATAFTKGGKEAVEIMKHGQTAEQAAKLQLPQELNSGSKILDAATNVVFRAMAASDRIFYNGALKRNLLDRAKAQALTEARQGKIKHREVKKRAGELVKSPPDEMLDNAKHDALVATFNNNNRLSDGLRRLRGNLPPTANFAIDLVLPFDRTPTNVVARVIEASPLGFLKAVTGGYKKSPLQVAKSIINKTMTTEEQRQFSQTMGRASAGSAIIALGWAMGAKGIMSAFYDDDDDKESRAQNRKNKEQGKSPSAIKIGNQWLSVGDSYVGYLLSLGATLQKEMSEAKDTGGRLLAVPKTATDVFFEQPLLGSAKDLFKAAGDLKGKGANYGGRLASSFIPAAGTVRDIATATDDKARKTFGFKGQVFGAVPGLRQKLPEDPGVQHRRSWAVDPFRMTTDKGLGALSKGKF